MIPSSDIKDPLRSGLSIDRPDSGARRRQPDAEGVGAEAGIDGQRGRRNQHAGEYVQLPGADAAGGGGEV